MTMKTDTGYIGASDLFFHDGQSDIICMCKTGYIHFYSADLLYIFNRILEAFSYYARWMDTCKEAIDSGCTLTNLLEITENVLSYPMIIVDASQFMIGFSPKALNYSDSAEWKQLLHTKSIASQTLRQFNLLYRDSFKKRHCFHLPADFFPSPSCCQHIFVQDERMATLIVVEDEKPLSMGKQKLMELFTPCLSNWLQINMAADNSFHGTSFFAKTLDGAPTAPETLTRRLSLFGWEPDCRKAIYIASTMSEAVHFDTYLGRMISNESEGIYSIPYQKNLVILCNLDMLDRDHFENTLHMLMIQNNYYCARSFLFTDTAQIMSAYHQTLQALQKSTPQTGKIYSCERFAMEYITNLVETNMQISLLHPLPLQIKEYDKKNHTNYYETLFCFLKFERNHQLTANALFIHRNTLFLRLRKIQELWPLDLDDKLLRFYILYSFFHLEYNMHTQ